MSGIPKLWSFLVCRVPDFVFFSIRPGKFGHPEVWRLTCKSSRQEKLWVAVQALEPQKARQEAENQAQGIDSWSKNPGFLGPLGVPWVPWLVGAKKS